MKIRVISLLLVLVLVAMLIPAPVQAAGDVSTAQIERQIRSAYARALSASGRTSFHGWCGSFVGWQTYILGIDKQVTLRDGRDAFNYYSGQRVTSGDYKVESYPAGRYTLKQALNAITKNGTQDAYNILVGFQKTNTQAGSIYGHAMVIHAIIDGRVYFAESYDALIGGKKYKEGTPINCSINTFCTYYDRWTQLDGVVHFGIKSFADVCAEYPLNMDALTLEDAPLYKDPLDLEAGEHSDPVGMLMRGQKVRINALYRTPNGIYWYRVDVNGENLFVRETQMKTLGEVLHDDLILSNLKLPTNIKYKAGHVVKGHVTSSSSVIDSLTISVYPIGSEKASFSGTLETASKIVTLDNIALDRAMKFRKLKVGNYRLLITARVTCYVLQEGEPTPITETVTLWDSDFEVYKKKKQHVVVSFHANGGETAINNTVVKKGATLTGVPEATRMGYKFLGWSLDQEGTSMITEDTTFSANKTLYAQWEYTGVYNDGWNSTENGWVYCQNGAPVEGWVLDNDIAYYQENGKLITGFCTLRGRIHYFNEAGAMGNGWQMIDGNTYYIDGTNGCYVDWMENENGRYYFHEDGKMHIGWLELDGIKYHMGEDGRMTTGCVSIDGRSCHFADDGAIVMEQVVMGDGSYYLVYDREFAKEHLSDTDRMLLV